MRLVSLELNDWRNLAFARVESDSRFVVLAGDNAQGKTNILEAAWVVATLRSFREARVSRLVRDGAPRARLVGAVTGQSGRRTLDWRRERGGGRSLRVDGRPTADLSAWFGVLRAVLFCPEHVAVVRGEPSERRKFIDRAAFTASPTHLDVVRSYRRVVQQKAAALRTRRADPAVVAIFDAQLATLGARLAVRRQRVLEELREPFREMHTAIAGGGEVQLRMRGLGAVAAEGEAAVSAAIVEALEKARVAERERGRVLVGPHRDDLDIQLDGRGARAFASQGQARSLVLALKLAELEAAKRRGEAPLFLLDDLTSELDRGRMERLVELLADLPNQVWITTTDPAWIGPLPGGDSQIVRVEAGALRAP